MEAALLPMGFSQPHCPGRRKGTNTGNCWKDPTARQVLRAVPGPHNSPASMASSFCMTEAKQQVQGHTCRQWRAEPEFKCGSFLLQNVSHPCLPPCHLPQQRKLAFFSLNLHSAFCLPLEWQGEPSCTVPTAPSTPEVLRQGHCVLLCQCPLLPLLLSPH